MLSGDQHTYIENPDRTNEAGRGRRPFGSVCSTRPALCSYMLLSKSRTRRSSATHTRTLQLLNNILFTSPPHPTPSASIHTVPPPCPWSVHKGGGTALGGGGSQSHGGLCGALVGVVRGHGEQHRGRGDGRPTTSERVR